MKKFLIAAATAAALALFMVPVSYAVEIETESMEAAIETAATESAEELDPAFYIETLCSGDAASLIDRYPHTESFLGALEYIGGMEGLQESIGKNGKLISMEEPEVVQIGGIVNYSVLCTFEAKQMILVINIDGEKKVAGVETWPYQKNEASPESEQSDQKNEASPESEQSDREAEDAARQSERILDIFRDMAIKALQAIPAL